MVDFCVLILDTGGNQLYCAVMGWTKRQEVFHLTTPDNARQSIGSCLCKDCVTHDDVVSIVEGLEVENRALKDVIKAMENGGRTQ